MRMRSTGSRQPSCNAPRGRHGGSPWHDSQPFDDIIGGVNAI